jgi:dCMP deaminase
MTEHKRADWDSYFMQMAHHVATRATCDRKHVGAVIVLERRVIATGYNGSPPGMAHCDDIGHDIIDTLVRWEGETPITAPNCVRTIHAEVNAIAQAAKYGTRLKGASLYCNTFPCWPCFKLIAASGIEKFYYDDAYRTDTRVVLCAEASNIKLIGPDAWKAGAPL